MDIISHLCFDCEHYDLVALLLPPLCPLLCSAARAKAEAIEGIEEVLQSGVENNLLDLVNMSAAEIADGIDIAALAAQQVRDARARAPALQ